VCREARDGACVIYAKEARAEAKEQLGTGACEEVSGGGPSTCKTCGAVIGGTKYCSACNVDSNTASAPVDGQCTTENNECPQKANGMCTQCDHESFMFKGGCYRTGQDPGQVMCKTAVNGVCTVAADGNNYFIPPEAQNTDQSIMACNDTTGITLTNKKKYVGVANCKTCNVPNTASGSTAEAAVCTACEDGYFGAACTACEDDNCITCTEAGTGKCSKCKATNTAGAQLYLKTASSSPTGTCVEASQCGPAAFPKDDAENGNKCASCSSASDGGIADCKTCSKDLGALKCSACTTEGKKPNTTGAACVACNIANCASCDKENVCEACTNSKKLSPLKDACLTDCPAGTYDNTNVCTPCHTSCSSCSDAGEFSCTACYPGHVLNKSDSGSTGTCIPECTGRYAENCEAGMCTAVLGGSKYCSKCKSGYVPVDGLCVSATRRAAPTGCAVGDGVCSSCTDTYFLESGGCYQSTAYPGKTLCSTASNGKCTACANTQTPDQQGSCPACPANCASCTGTDTKTCTKCFLGYYLDSAKACKKCSETSGNIQGVENCISCLAPTSPNTLTPVTCYVTQTPAVDPADPSVNKGGLSSGAIAGISVAVIAVVGGLVGFLCWWFVCRGKA
ncbi:Variant-specific surface protein, partial [Giardia duodenalis]